MSILWCGGEDIDFPNGATPGSSIGGSARRSAYSRIALQPSILDSRSNNFVGGAISTGWLSFYIWFGSFTVDLLLAGLIKDSSTPAGLWIGLDSVTNTKLALHKYNGTTKTKLAASTNAILLTSVLYKVDVHLENYGEDATVNVYIDGDLIITYNGDVTVSGVADLSAVGIMSTAGYLSEIIVADEDTRAMSLVTHYPSAEGLSSDWTGAYTDIDEITTNKGDVVYDNTDGHKAFFGLSDLPAGAFSILAVKESVDACRSADSTPAKLRIGISGEISISGEYALDTFWETKERLMSVNPVTSNAFTMAEIDALQIILESEA